MDILESLTADFDRLRDLTIDLTLAASAQDRETHFRSLARLHDVTMKARASALNVEGLDVLEFAKRKMLERSDLMEEIATGIHRTNRSDLKETKMDLYSDLVLQQISDCEREILPLLYEMTSETERRQMGSVYEKYRDIALDLHSVDHSRAV